MCELLALSANTPTDLRFSFRGLRRRGGATGQHGDGWGLASYDPDGLGVSLYRADPRPVTWVHQSPRCDKPMAGRLAGVGWEWDPLAGRR